MFKLLVLFAAVAAVHGGLILDKPLAPIVHREPIITRTYITKNIPKVIELQETKPAVETKLNVGKDLGVSIGLPLFGKGLDLDDGFLLGKGLDW